MMRSVSNSKQHQICLLAIGSEIQFDSRLCQWPPRSSTPMRCPLIVAVTVPTSEACRGSVVALCDSTLQFVSECSHLHLHLFHGSFTSRRLKISDGPSTLASQDLTIVASESDLTASRLYPPVIISWLLALLPVLRSTWEKTQPSGEFSQPKTGELVQMPSGGSPSSSSTSDIQSLF